MFATLNKAASRNAVNLFFLGCATLFLELVLIRYLAGNIWNLGYFPNLVLMAVFVGMGLGFGLNRNLKEARLFVETLLARHRLDSFVAACSEIHLLAKQFESHRCIDPLLIIARQWLEGSAE